MFGGFYSELFPDKYELPYNMKGECSWQQQQQQVRYDTDKI
jgi:hypothetical protein